MACSMTGMGRVCGEIKEPPIKFEVEIKSYNHRFLEVSVKCPTTLLPFEDEIRRSVQKRVSRGRVVVIIQQDREILTNNIETDKPLLQAYLKLTDELKDEYNIGGTIDINTLLSVQGLIKFSQQKDEVKNIFEKFKPIFEKAMDSFLTMKKKEGENITGEIRKSIDKIEENIDRIEKLIPARNDNYENHLLKIMKKYKNEMNEERFYQELLYTIDRTDITEECKRLFSHLAIFREALDREVHPGRKLNFLLQEMQREANTCSVKANFLEISKAVIQIKEEVEKIREQVQNIE